MINNKKGWIRIVEVFTAILLIMGVVFTLVGDTYVKKTDSSLIIYEQETSILRDIQLNNTLRNEILDASSLPIEWGAFESSGLTNLKNKIIEETPDDFNCTAKLCSINDDCILSSASNQDIYVRSVSIFADSGTYAPRKLKLFCGEE